MYFSARFTVEQCFRVGKRVVDFLLVLIELFSLDVTAEGLRAKIDRKSITNHFTRIVRPINALQLRR